MKKSICPNLGILKFFVFVGFCFFPTMSLFLSSARADEEDKDLVSVQYNGQDIFSCMGVNYKIPTYFPTMDKFSTGKFYLVTMNSKCTDGKFEVNLGMSADCMGQSSCARAGFFLAPRSITDNYFEDVLYRYTMHFMLEKNVTGYFIPSQCGANCDQAKLVWFNNEKVHILSSASDNSQRTIDDLVKAANSYIASEN